MRTECAGCVLRRRDVEESVVKDDVSFNASQCAGCVLPERRDVEESVVKDDVPLMRI